jgi:hypothetical protein
MMGNPDHQHDSLGEFAARASVRALRISAYDHPNVVTGRDVVPGAVSRKSILNRLEDAHGNVDDPIFKSRVRGIAPAQAKNALIHKDWLDQAAARANDPAYRVGGRAMGIDLADSQSGDRAAISDWEGAYAKVRAFKCPDASLLGEQIVEQEAASRNPIDGRRVGIDSAGLGGPVYKAMRRHGLKGIRPLNGGKRPLPMLDRDILWSEVERGEDGSLSPAGPKIVGSEQFDNLRSQILWLLAEDLRLGHIALEYNKELWEELLALTKESDAGKIWIHEKSEVRKKIKRSPDMADALAYGNFVRDRAWIPKGDGTVVAEPPKSQNRDRGLEKYLARAAERAKAEERRIRRQYRRLA